jgi:hypothetical protein
MIGVVRQVSTFGSDRVRLARDTATVIHLLRNEENTSPPALPIKDLGALTRFEYGPPTVDLYDCFLNQEMH